MKTEILTSRLCRSYLMLIRTRHADIGIGHILFAINGIALSEIKQLFITISMNFWDYRYIR